MFHHSISIINLHATGLWLEIIYLTFSAFYDKSLSPEERMINASIVRAILITWREASTKGKAVTRHFITHPTYVDIITGIDGLILYLVTNTTQYPQQPIVPWYFNSDHCEQTYAFLRTGRHKGRRTNLSSMDVLQGTSRMNRSLELDRDGLHLLKHSTAHTRGRTLIPDPKETRIFFGKDTSNKKLQSAMREGVEIARGLMKEHTKLDEPHSRLDDSDDDLPDDDSDSEEEFSSSDDDDIEMGSSSDFVSSEGKYYHLDTATEKYLNDGTGRMSGQTRKKKDYRSGRV